MLEHLKTLGAHIAGLDSGSQDAAAIQWAASEIERLRGALQAICNMDGGGLGDAIDIADGALRAVATPATND